MDMLFYQKIYMLNKIRTKQIIYYIKQIFLLKVVYQIMVMSIYMNINIQHLESKKNIKDALIQDVEFVNQVQIVYHVKKVFLYSVKNVKEILMQMKNLLNIIIKILERICLKQLV